MSSFFLPISFAAGSFVLEPYRLVLLFFIGPCLLGLLRKRLGKLQLVDYLMFFFACWYVVSLTYHYGLGKGVESGGILAIEGTGGYLIARKYVDSYERFCKSMALCIVLVGILSVPCLYEMLTGTNCFGRTSLTEMRLNLHRAHGPFQHAIVLGIFAGSVFAICIVITKAMKSLGRCITQVAVFMTTMASLSTGALVDLFAQVQLLIWATIFHRHPAKWKLLFTVLLILYICLDFASNRTPIRVFFDYLTFNPGTGYYRQNIWEYGTLEVMRHPVFGIGFEDWTRASWMVSSSIDNFWLVLGIRHGLPSALSLLAGSILMVVQVLKANRRFNFQPMRQAWAISFTALILAAVTVHYWGPLYVHFCFLLGTGAVLTTNLQQHTRRSQILRRTEHPRVR